MNKLFFTTDIHGSESCWRKLLSAGELFKADCLILGGDIAGRGIQLLVRDKSSVWTTSLKGQQYRLESEKALREMEKFCRDVGMYPCRVSREQARTLTESKKARDSMFKKLAIESINRWIEMAGEKLGHSGRRLIVMPGNIDPFYIDDLFKNCEFVEWAQRKTVFLDATHRMISEGCANPAPWREVCALDEKELSQVLEKQIRKLDDVFDAVFNIHVPPFDSGLDYATSYPKKTKQSWFSESLNPLGSKTVRRLIETYQPLLSLHGHVHGIPSQFTYLGRTLCLNPGSLSYEGVLTGVLINLSPSGIEDFQPVQG